MSNHSLTSNNSCGSSTPYKTTDCSNSDISLIISSSAPETECCNDTQPQNSCCIRAKYQEGEASRINREVNLLFMQKIESLNNSDDPDFTKRFAAYQEWIIMLLKMNEAILRNSELLETRVFQRICEEQQNMTQPCYSDRDIVERLRGDLDKLIKLVRKAHSNNEWNFCDVQFDAISTDEFLAKMNRDSEDSELSDFENNIPATSNKVCCKAKNANRDELEKCSPTDFNNFGECGKTKNFENGSDDDSITSQFNFADFVENTESGKKGDLKQYSFTDLNKCDERIEMGDALECNEDESELNCLNSFEKFGRCFEMENMCKQNDSGQDSSTTLSNFEECFDGENIETHNNKKSEKNSSTTFNSFDECLEPDEHFFQNLNNMDECFEMQNEQICSCDKSEQKECSSRNFNISKKYSKPEQHPSLNNNYSEKCCKMKNSQVSPYDEDEQNEGFSKNINNSKGRSNSEKFCPSNFNNSKKCCKMQNAKVFPCNGNEQKQHTSRVCPIDRNEQKECFPKNFNNSIQSHKSVQHSPSNLNDSKKCCKMQNAQVSPCNRDEQNEGFSRNFNITKQCQKFEQYSPSNFDDLKKCCKVQNAQIFSRDRNEQKQHTSRVCPIDKDEQNKSFSKNFNNSKQCQKFEQYSPSNFDDPKKCCKVQNVQVSSSDRDGQKERSSRNFRNPRECFEPEESSSTYVNISNEDFKQNEYASANFNDLKKYFEMQNAQVCSCHRDQQMECSFTTFKHLKQNSKPEECISANFNNIKDYFEMQNVQVSPCNRDEQKEHSSRTCDIIRQNSKPEECAATNFNNLEKRKMQNAHASPCEGNRQVSTTINDFKKCSQPEQYDSNNFQERFNPEQYDSMNFNSSQECHNIQNAQVLWPSAKDRGKEYSSRAFNNFQECSSSEQYFDTNFSNSEEGFNMQNPKVYPMDEQQEHSSKTLNNLKECPKLAQHSSTSFSNSEEGFEMQNAQMYPIGGDGQNNCSSKTLNNLEEYSQPEEYSPTHFNNFGQWFDIQNDQTCPSVSSSRTSNNTIEYIQPEKFSAANFNNSFEMENPESYKGDAKYTYMESIVIDYKNEESAQMEAMRKCAEEMEKRDICSKLDFYRQFLIYLDTADCVNIPLDEWNLRSLTNTTYDHDIQIIDCVKKRFKGMCDSIMDLHSNVEQLENERNELYTNLDLEKNNSQWCVETLKELASILRRLCDEDLSSEELHCTKKGSANENPFLDSIIHIVEKYEKRCEKLGLCLKNADNKMQMLEDQISKLNAGENEEEQFTSQKMQCTINQLRTLVNEKEERIQYLNDTIKKLSPAGQEINKQSEDSAYNDKEYWCVQLAKANAEILCLRSSLECAENQERMHASQTNSLNLELLELRRKNGELIIYLRKLNGLLHNQEACRAGLIEKFKNIENSYQDQSKCLSSANSQMKFLQNELAKFENAVEENQMERTLLREEVMGLKEREAELIGKNKCIEIQYNKLEQDLDKAHCIIKKQQSTIQHNDSSHGDLIKQLQKSHEEAEMYLNCLSEENKNLKDENMKCNEINEHNMKMIESFRKWKESQMEADNNTQMSFAHYDAHIKLLLEDRQDYMEKYTVLKQDFHMLKEELDRLRCFKSCIPEQNQQINRRIDVVRHTSQRVSDQCNQQERTRSRRRSNIH